MCSDKNIILLVIPFYEAKEDNQLIAFIIDRLKKLKFVPEDKYFYLETEGFYENLSVLKELRELAEKRGGKLLSKSYISKLKLKWQCAEGHTWEAIASAVKIGTWCPVCAERVPLTLEDMHKIAHEKGGTCLSENYTNNKTLKWQCSEGHFFWVKPNTIKTLDVWCPYCSKRRRLTIDDMHQLARNHGGKCLSKDYINSSTKLTWECKQGHIWEATPNDVKNNNNWCWICGIKKRAETQKLTIDEMYKLAEVRGGECLSKEYLDASSKLKWKCDNGHVWEATPNSIKNNKTWCSICGGSAKGNINEMRKIAEERGGKCLSEIYLNSKTKLIWECAKGHVWESIPNQIKNGTWCPECSGNKKRTIEDMREIAQQRGGKCLSSDYKNNKTKLTRECKQGHVWESIPKTVIHRGSWCLTCSRI